MYIRKFLQIVSVISLAVFVLLGVLMVLIQLAAIITLNGTLAASVGVIRSISIASSGVLGVCSFILSYLKKPSKK